MTASSVRRPYPDDAFRKLARRGQRRTIPHSPLQILRLQFLTAGTTRGHRWCAFHPDDLGSVTRCLPINTAATSINGVRISVLTLATSRQFVPVVTSATARSHALRTCVQKVRVRRSVDNGSVPRCSSACIQKDRGRPVLCCYYTDRRYRRRLRRRREGVRP